MYETLVLSSGGIRGLALLGALSKLNNKGYLNKINHYIACSTGSLISFLYIIGYTFDNIIQLYLKLDIWKIFNITLDSILNITTTLGIIDSTLKFKNILNILLLNSKFKHIKLSELTFIKLYNLTKKKLTICITDLNKFECSYLNYENVPNMLVEESIRMSCAIPFIFQPINNCIDGAVCEPYPINQTDDIIKTIGIRVRDITHNNNKKHKLIQHIFNIVRSIENNNNNNNMTEDIKDHTITILCSRNNKDKNAILESGLLEGEKFIEKYKKIKPIFHKFTKKNLNKLKDNLIYNKVRMSSTTYAISQANKVAKLAAYDAVESLKKIEWLLTTQGLNIKKLEQIVNKFKKDRTKKLEAVINFEEMRR